MKPGDIFTYWRDRFGDPEWWLCEAPSCDKWQCFLIVGRSVAGGKFNKRDDLDKIKVIPEDQVPDWVWSKLAERRLAGEST